MADKYGNKISLIRIYIIDSLGKMMVLHSDSLLPKDYMIQSGGTVKGHRFDRPREGLPAIDVSHPDLPGS